MKTTDNTTAEIEYQVGQHIVRARSYEEACRKLDDAYFGETSTWAALKRAEAQRDAALAALREIKRETDESRDFRAAAICAAIAHKAIAASQGGAQ